MLLQNGKQEITMVSGGAARQYNNEVQTTGAITDAPNAPGRTAQPVQLPVGVEAVTFQQSPTSCLSWKNVSGDHNITVMNKEALTPKAPVKLAPPR